MCGLVNPLHFDEVIVSQLVFAQEVSGRTVDRQMDRGICFWHLPLGFYSQRSSEYTLNMHS